MDTRSFAIVIIAAGLVMVVIGLIALAGGLSWFGNLPGDIRYRSNGTRVYIPITSMILISVVLSIGLALIRRLL
ncbi:MAG TPA: DUF2905 domain-containing protein [Thermomicrobiales bacterium]|nr:DUF2905 domain-containing protein [Thermomicrobiales bacterium]